MGKRILSSSYFLCLSSIFFSWRISCMVISRPRKSSLRKIKKKEKKKWNKLDGNELFNYSQFETNKPCWLSGHHTFGHFSSINRKSTYGHVRKLWYFLILGWDPHKIITIFKTNHHLVFQCFPAHKSFLQILLPLLIGSCLLSQAVFDRPSVLQQLVKRSMSKSQP